MIINLENPFILTLIVVLGGLAGSFAQPLINRWVLKKSSKYKIFTDLIDAKSDKKELEEFKTNMAEYKTRIGMEIEALKKANEIQTKAMIRVEKLLIFLVQKGGDDPTKIKGLMDG